MTIRIEHGDMREVLARLIAEGVRVDSIVTDPPYHLQSIVKRFAKSPRTEASMPTAGPYERQSRGFMGKMWDGGDIAFQAEGFDAILVEREAEYVADIRRRLDHVRGDDTPLFQKEAV